MLFIFCFFSIVSQMAYSYCNMSIDNFYRLRQALSEGPSIRLCDQSPWPVTAMAKAAQGRSRQRNAACHAAAATDRRRRRCRPPTAAAAWQQPTGTAAADCQPLLPTARRCGRRRLAADRCLPPAAGGDDGRCWSFLDDRTCSEPAAAVAATSILSRRPWAQSEADGCRRRPLLPPAADHGPQPPPAAAAGCGPLPASCCRRGRWAMLEIP